jgi:hypothetical protein
MYALRPAPGRQRVRQTCGEAHYFKIEEPENHRCKIADAEVAGFRRAVAAYRQAFKSCPGLMAVRAYDGMHLIYEAPIENRRPERRHPGCGDEGNGLKKPARAVSIDPDARDIVQGV